MRVYLAFQRIQLSLYFQFLTSFNSYQIRFTFLVQVNDLINTADLQADNGDDDLAGQEICCTKDIVDKKNGSRWSAV